MVAIYTRQSLDKKDSISIEIQIEKCKTKFEESEEYNVYKDKGYSGKNTNRPAFENMVSDIESGLITMVVVYKVDRISRSVLDFANIVKIFEKHNVTFISSSEDFDTSKPMGIAMLQLIMVFAELERKQIQLRITDNYYSRGEKGFFLGGPTAFGFEKEKTKINGIKTSTFRSHPELMPVVEKMYSMYSYSDMSLGKISDWFNDNGIPAARGGRWDSCKVSRILRSPMYVRADIDIYNYYRNRGCTISNNISDFIGVNGCYLYGKRESNERKYTRVDKHVLSIGLHEGTIDSRTWLLTQYKLDNNKQIKNSGKGRHSWLSGLIKCGYCGYAMSVIKAGHGNTKYFNCRGKTNLKICSGHSEPIIVDEVEDIVKKSLLQKIEELKGQSITFTKNDDVKINQLKIEITDIDMQIENLIAQMAEGNAVVTKYINEKISSLDKRKNTLLEETKKYTITASRDTQVDDMISKFTNWDDMGNEERKSVCGWFISKVNITDNEIDINWKL